mgnify:CR=1 FL=1
MTCVVALRDVAGRIVMGCDSAGVGSWYSLQNRSDRKIYRNGPCLFGFTSSFRMGQLLGYSLEVPKFYEADFPGLPLDAALQKFMVTKFVDAVRNCLKAGGYAAKDKEVETAGTFLVAFRGEIFQVCDDYQVSRHLENYAAVGCGFDLALGSLFTSDGWPAGSLGGNSTDEALTRVKLALAAAANFSAGVRGPFHFEELLPS